MNLLLCVLIGLCGISSVLSKTPTEPEFRPIPNQYLIQLDPTAVVTSQFMRQLRSASYNVTDWYRLESRGRVIVNGFLATDMSSDEAKKISENPLVKTLTQNREIKTASWGLDRIDQRFLPQDGLDFLPEGYGNDAHIYVLDTGIRVSHDDFGGRASFDADFSGEGAIPDDGNGHGTHVAGIAGGRTYGVAKGARLHAVKVLTSSGFGTVAGLIDGLIWTAVNAQQPAVINLSLVASFDPFLNFIVDAINAFLNIPIVVAAANANMDACLFSPGSAAEAYTVAASTHCDGKASFSNFGVCTNIYAPGTNIKSAFIGSDCDTRVLSGTSMAAPFVAGVAAIIRDRDPSLSANDVKNQITTSSTMNIITPPSLDNNHLVYTSPYL